MFKYFAIVLVACIAFVAAKPGLVAPLAYSAPVAASPYVASPYVASPYVASPYVAASYAAPYTAAAYTAPVLLRK
ncbi:pupal cuticle protein C1B-like isoform X2 [Teleopsis dalmanni]|uniref:pupal cuticle protein C1B-like isoform X2 n=1 Tax=Teleopsis dalmanni TaxID=139649 RepID=UPI0018CF143B|nr:pupal cuticle protein C1B-like isoform X2 [Teleopsis dalmanni]